MLQDQIIQNLAVLAAHALGGKSFSAEPEQMAELWGQMATVKKYLLERPKQEPATKEEAKDVTL